MLKTAEVSVRSPETAEYLGCEASQPFRQESALEKVFRILIDGGGTTIAYLIEMNRKLRSIEGASFA
jgi:hypothetical protein